MADSCGNFKDAAEHMARSKYNTDGLTAQQIWGKSDSLAEFLMTHDALIEAESADALNEK